MGPPLDLLTSNLPAARQADLAVSGDETITGILLRTRAIGHDHA